MEKIESIKKTVKFYKLANKLKTTIIDEVGNFSIADNIYGSMILAIAMDSEFKEIDNIGRLLRMILLDEFSKLNPNYSIQDNFKKGQQYQGEIDEARALRSKEAKLIFKYRVMDCSLTKLLLQHGESLDYNDLLTEGLKILMPNGSDEYSKCAEIFKFYYLNFKLKNKIRSGWDSKHWNINAERLERISEHIVGAIALAIAMDSEFDKNIEIDEILKMLAIHEIGEVLIGDITPFDGITPEQKKEIEHKAMAEVIGNLSEKNSLLKILFDFDSRISNEAIFAHLCDKMEADLQSKLYQDSGLHRSLDDQAGNCVLKNAKVQAMLNNGALEPFDIWYEWDKGLYDSATFPEFFNLLKLLKDNNIFNLTDCVLSVDEGVALHLKRKRR